VKFRIHEAVFLGVTRWSSWDR